MDKLKRAFIIIPAKNEEKTIKNVVEKTKKVCNKMFDRVDVIVVNDGSTDRTQIEALSSGARIIRHPVNFGKGKVYLLIEIEYVRFEI